MLTKEGGFGGSPVDLFACGLAKSEGYPRANNTEAAPVKEERLGDARKGCAAWCAAGPRGILCSWTAWLWLCSLRLHGCCCLLFAGMQRIQSQARCASMDRSC